MEPEEMDLVELVEDVTVEPSWRIKPEAAILALSAGQRGMVIHRHEGTPPRFDVEFVDPTTNEAQVLATLRIEQIQVVERDTLGIE